MSLHTNVKYDNISRKFEFQGPQLIVKITMAIFRKTLSSLWHLHLFMSFNVTLHKCWV